MTLKAVIDDVTSLPPALRDFYVEQDGKFSLNVEGLVPKARLDEFRDNNIKLAQERDELRQRYEGIDEKKARELLAIAQNEKDKKLIEAGKVDELLAQRVDAMRTDYEEKLTSETTKSVKLQEKLESLLIDGALRDEAAKAGVRASAIEDVLLRGRAVFKLVEGKAMPFENDEIIYSKTGEPLRIEDWVKALSTHAPHLFEPNKGAGSRGGATSIVGQKFIEAGDVQGFLTNLADIARHNIRIS